MIARPAFDAVRHGATEGRWPTNVAWPSEPERNRIGLGGILRARDVASEKHWLATCCLCISAHSRPLSLGVVCRASTGSDSAPKPWRASDACVSQCDAGARCAAQCVGATGRIHTTCLKLIFRCGVGPGVLDNLIRFALRWRIPSPLIEGAPAKAPYYILAIGSFAPPSGPAFCTTDLAVLFQRRKLPPIWGMGKVGGTTNLVSNADQKFAEIAPIQRGTFMKRFISGLALVSLAASASAFDLVRQNQIGTDVAPVTPFDVVIPGFIVSNLDFGQIAELAITGGSADVTYTFLGKEGGFLNGFFNSGGSTPLILNTDVVGSSSVQAGVSGLLDFSFSTFGTTTVANGGALFDEEPTFAIFDGADSGYKWIVGYSDAGAGKDRDYDDMVIGVNAAIPEPQTYALLLAGLAAVGFVARRRLPA